MIKRSLCTILMVLLLAIGSSGCGSGEKAANSTSDGSKIPAVAYTENEIPASQLENVTSMALNTLDQLVLYDSAGLKSKFVVQDSQGKVIKQIPCPAQGKESDYIDGSVFALDQHNNLYQLQQIEVYDRPNADEASEYIRRLLLYNPDGKLEKTIELGRSTGNNELHAASMAVDGKGNTYILYYGGKIDIIDQSGKITKSISGANYRSVDLDKDGNMVLVGRNDSEYYLVKLNNSGKTLWKQPLTDIKNSVMGFKYNRYDGCYYIADYSGIKKYDAAGHSQGEILNYRTTSIFVSDVLMSGIAVDKPGSLYINIMYNGSSSASGKPFSIFRYKPGKASTVPQGPKKVLTLAAADPDNALTMEKAARLFQKKHPEIQVEIKDYTNAEVQPNDPARYEKYIKTMNTEILSGKGPDIISLQGLPCNKYIDKKVLVDLNPIMKKDKTFKHQDYYDNILTACERQGRLYGMPISFRVPVIIADGTMLKKADTTIKDSQWTWADFYAAAKKLSRDTNHDGKLETYAFPTISNGGLLDYMLASDYRSFVDEDKKQVHFNSERFIKFLEIYKELNSTYTNSKIDRNSLFLTGNRSSIAFKPAPAFDGTMSLEKCEMGSEALALALPRGTSPKDKPFDADMLAINRASKYQNEAWQFLKFVTSKEQQTTLQIYGTRINRLAQEQYFDELSKMQNSTCMIGSEDGTRSFEQEPLSPAQLARVRQLIAGLNHCNNINPQIRKIIDIELASFLKGEKSAAETAKVLQNKVTLYLNE